MDASPSGCSTASRDLASPKPVTSTPLSGDRSNPNPSSTRTDAESHLNDNSSLQNLPQSERVAPQATSPRKADTLHPHCGHYGHDDGREPVQTHCETCEGYGHDDDHSFYWQPTTAVNDKPGRRGSYEDTKREWYRRWIGDCSAEKNDPWGFSSASNSRPHTPLART